MDALRAKRISAHYRMPARAVSEKPRLDRILQDSARDWLGEALDREGIGGGELICLRRVRTRLRIKLSSSDENIAAQWALQVAEAVRTAAESGSSDVVRYRSRGHALADLVVKVLNGDRSRQWAWQQLGLADNSGQTDHLIVQALQSEPTLITPVMVAVAEQGRLPALLTRLASDTWLVLAELAWQTSGGSLSSHESAIELAANGIDQVDAAAARIIQNSKLVQAARWYRGVAPDAIRHAAAIFGVLEFEPSAALGQHGRAWIAAVEAKLSEEHATVESNPLALKADAASSAIDRRFAIEDRRTTNDNTALDEQPLPTFESRFGGVFLLFRLLAELDLFASLATSFSTRSLPWTLQQLALKLLPAAETDPAVLAFAGRRPSSISPAQGEPVATPEEDQLLSDYAARITAELKARLPDLELRGGALLQFVCQRWCRIEADPGWFQIYYSLSDVSTDIRRAALDLDPGYLRWLGVTVVFRYE